MRHSYISVAAMLVLLLLSLPLAADDLASGRAALETGQVDQAIQYLKAAADKDALNVTARDLLIKALFLKVEQLTNMNKALPVPGTDVQLPRPAADSALVRVAIEEEARSMGLKPEDVKTAVRWAIVSNVPVGADGKPDRDAVKAAINDVLNRFHLSDQSGETATRPVGTQIQTNNLAVLEPDWKVKYDRVEGVIKNISNRTLYNLAVTFNVLNKQGQIIEEIRDFHFTNLLPGEEWKFKAMIIDPEVRRKTAFCNLSEIGYLIRPY